MDRRIVLINQAANYLTVGLANAFAKKFDDVALVAGSIHVQGEELLPRVQVSKVNRWRERPPWRKGISYVVALVRMWFLLVLKYRSYDVIFVSVPPMGYLLNLFVPHRFSMVIWDVYPDVLKVTGMEESHWIYRLWAACNRRSFKRAWSVFTISPILASSISQYVSREKITVHPIWSIFQSNGQVPRGENGFIAEHGLNDKFVVQYSGNIGVTHNVEVILDVARQMQKEERILFQIIGRGPRLPAVERDVQKEALSNVQILPFQSDSSFRYSLSAADLGVVILHDAVSQGSVPSKAYNLMSFGIPGLYIASPQSELATYALRYGNARCFAARDIDEICSFIKLVSTDLDLQTRMRKRAEIAAKDFRRTNADLFVESYIRTARV